MRLVGGRLPWEGRVEVHNGSAWGTVCDDEWDQREATVVCRGFGYGDGTTVDYSSFGEGTGPIHLTNLGCLGDEENLGYCFFDDWGTDYCDHDDDVGVICSGPPQFG